MRQNLQGLEPQRRLKLENDLLRVHAELLAAPAVVALRRDPACLVKDILVINLDTRSWMHWVLRAVSNDLVPQTR